ncbi:apolipoprotein N-acyltransferase (plasmid) [Rhodococcus pyridinivorans]|uniref:apolipoprotein N-acyltransferase n=1 Tax=Rhodococcus pyridinivorans TaxID=103816 RepID=UPI0020C724F0|nr:apolipoprotein N-acyltransferase [Rhodococcus pyridinivorans]UTM39984.1 apolipoprotein N-acyltransferase [Rhodococcus pyridinivorans]
MTVATRIVDLPVSVLRHRASWSGVLWRCAAAIVAGLGLYASFPPRTSWWLAPIAIAVLTAAVTHRSVKGGFGYGYLAGLGFFLPLLPWVGVYVGAMPWLALAAAQAVAVGAFGALTAVLSRRPAAPLMIAGAWVVTEAVRARVPFGGFPWGRLAFGQAEGPLLPLASLAGAPGVSFTVALAGTALVAGLGRVRAGRWRAARGCALLAAAPLLLAPFAAHRQTPNVPGSTVTVAAVQGNVPRMGLEFNAQRRAVLDNHVAVTEQLAAAVTAGRQPRPQLVIWPENSSDIDPLRHRDARTAIDRAATAIGVPLLVGAVLDNGDGTSSNSALVWDPATGPGPQHVKRRLVPFGEYLPLRPVIERLVPAAAQAGNFVPGDGTGRIELNGVPVAVATCYEVAFDDAVTDSVRAGAQLITVPTNNATFGRTEMTYQQLAMSRVRAVEHGRSVVVAATSGVSALITPDGQVIEQSAMFTPDLLVGELPLSTELTWATRLGPWPETVLSLIVVLPLLVRRRDRANP